LSRYVIIRLGEKRAIWSSTPNVVITVGTSNRLADHAAPHPLNLRCQIYPYHLIKKPSTCQSPGTRGGGRSGLMGFGGGRGLLGSGLRGFSGLRGCVFMMDGGSSPSCTHNPKSVSEVDTGRCFTHPIPLVHRGKKIRYLRQYNLEGSRWQSVTPHIFCPI
jgi:hypothetical protein